VKVLQLCNLLNKNLTVKIESESKTVPTKEFDREEISIIKFAFPIVYILKGTNEILTFHIANQEYIYIRLDMPFICLTSSKYDLSSITIYGILDAGPFLISVSINWGTEGNYYCYATIERRFFEKRNFPNQKLLGYYAMMTYVYPDKDENSTLLHFTNWMMAYSRARYDKFILYDIKYELEEIMHIQKFSSFIVCKK